MTDKGPSNKELNKQAEAEEEKQAEAGKKQKKNGWG